MDDDPDSGEQTAKGQSTGGLPRAGGRRARERGQQVCMNARPRPRFGGECNLLAWGNPSSSVAFRPPSTSGQGIVVNLEDGVQGDRQEAPRSEIFGGTFLSRIQATSASLRERARS